MITAIKTEQQKTSEGVADVLREGLEFLENHPVASVLVMMVAVDGEIFTQSKFESRLEMIGALQGAVIDAWQA